MINKQNMPVNIIKNKRDDSIGQVKTAPLTTKLVTVPSDPLLEQPSNTCPPLPDPEAWGEEWNNTSSVNFSPFPDEDYENPWKC